VVSLDLALTVKNYELGLINSWLYYLFFIETHVDFSHFELQYADIISTKTFCYRDFLFWICFVTGDFLLRKHSVMEPFGRGDVLCGSILHLRCILEILYIYCFVD
jgi:hypothetical protein